MGLPMIDGAFLDVFETSTTDVFVLLNLNNSNNNSISNSTIFSITDKNNNTNSNTNLDSNGSEPFDDGFKFLNASKAPQELISKEVFKTYLLVLWVFCNGVVSLLGMVTNGINIGVFYRMGLWDDSNTLGLMALAISDFLYLLSMAGQCVCWSPVFFNTPSLRWDPASLEYVVFSRSITVFSDTTCWLTAFLALQKCLCVIYPIKFKFMFSPSRNLIVVVGIFIFSVLSQSHLYYSEKLQWVFDPVINDTKLYATFREGHGTMITVTYFLNLIVLRSASVLIMIVCTKLITWKVGQSLQWRQMLLPAKSSPVAFPKNETADIPKDHQQEQQEQQHQKQQPQQEKQQQQQQKQQHQQRHHQQQQQQQQQQQPQSQNNTQNGDTRANSETSKKKNENKPSPTRQTNMRGAQSSSNNKDRENKQEPISVKEMKMIKIISQICIVFIVCYAPEIMVAYGSLLVPGLEYGGLYHSIYSTLYYFCFLTGAVNASINILIYLSLSTKYRKEIQEWMECCKQRHT